MHLLRDRFAHLAAEPGAPDWSDVLRRASRLSARSRPRGRRRALLIAAAALLAAVVLAGAAIAIRGVTSGVPAIDRLLDRATRGFGDVSAGAPVPRLHPQRGSLSDKLQFEFDGGRYTAVGFRAEDGSTCSAVVDPEAAQANGGVGCIGARSLRRGLARDPALLSGAGGGQPTIAHGFARADVVSLALRGAWDNGAVALSEAWRPAGEGGEPIRFFYVVTNSPAAGPRAPLLPDGVRIEARLEDGSVIELPR
jgi:hypothetical protein